MGWASGSRLFSAVIEGVKSSGIDFDMRKTIYEIVWDAFQENDWDTEDECLGEDPAYDSLYYEFYPKDDEEDVDWEDEGDDGC